MHNQMTERDYSPRESSSGVDSLSIEIREDEDFGSDSESEIDWRKNFRFQASLDNKQNQQMGIQTTKTIRNNKQRYWKVNFIVVLLPFLFWGIPVHLILHGNRGITSTRQWFKSIFTTGHPLVITFTICLFIYCLCINGFFFYLGLKFLDSLVRQGVIRENLFDDIITIFRTLPIVIPLDVVWIWGYSVRKLLLSFDRMTYPEVQVEIVSDFVDDKMKNVQNSKTSSGTVKTRMSNYRLRLIGVYMLTVVYLFINFFMFLEENERLDDDEFYEVNRFNNLVDFSLNSMYNIMLPVYVCFTFAIQFEFDMLSQYMKSLVQLGIAPDFCYFKEIKKNYKQISNHVIHVNNICSFYYSWVFVVLYLAMYNELEGIVVVLIIAFFTPLRDQLGPTEVRVFVGSLFSIILQNLVMGLSVWFVINTNDQARNIHVRLNDFVSEPNIIFTPELYKSYRMLKNYIHSRMETENPALLSVPSVSLLPCKGVYKWMNNYRVRH